jgi:hypothetical protein
VLVSNPPFERRLLELFGLHPQVCFVVSQTWPVPVQFEFTVHWTQALARQTGVAPLQHMELHATWPAWQVRQSLPAALQPAAQVV